MYYCQPEIIYVNISEEEEKEINTYIKMGLQKYRIIPESSTKEDLLKNMYKMMHVFNYIPPIIEKRRFIKCENNDLFIITVPRDKLIYYNNNTGQYFYSEDLMSINGKYFVKK